MLEISTGVLFWISTAFHQKSHSLSFLQNSFYPTFHISDKNKIKLSLWSFWSQKPKNYLMPHKRMCLMTAPQLPSSTVLPLLCPSLPSHFHYNCTLLVPSCFLPTRGGLMTSLPLTHSLSWKISSVITFWLCHSLAQKQIILHCLPNEIQNQVHIHIAAPSSLCGSPPGSTSFYSHSLDSGPVVLLLDLASQYIQRAFWTQESLNLSSKILT